MVRETALYEQLGINHDASGDEIRRSYRQAALRWHPDRNQDNPAAADNFKACLQAYEILSDPNKRATYDRHGMYGVTNGIPATQQPAPSSSASPSATNNNNNFHREWANHFQRDWARDTRERNHEWARESPPRWGREAQDEQEQRRREFFEDFFGDRPTRHERQERWQRSRSPLASQRWSTSGTSRGGVSFSFGGHSNQEQGQEEQGQEQGQQQGRPRFQTSYSFLMSTSTANNADGTYSTQYHTYDSRDGHRSGGSSGRIGDQGFDEFSRTLGSLFPAPSARTSLFAGSNMGFGLGNGLGNGLGSGFGNIGFGNGGARSRNSRQQPPNLFWL